MRILLLTFSGTGHTFLCGDFIKSHLVEMGHEVVHFKIENKNEFQEDVNSFDMIGIGYPIHAFNTPPNVAKFFKKFPVTKKDIPYFIYKVSGEPFAMNNASSYHLYRKLKKKGYVKVAEKHFLMPYNIIFRYKDAIAKQMYLYLKPLTKAFVLGIFNNEPEHIKYTIRHIILSFFFRIEWIAPKVNAPLSHMKKNCIKCNLCLNSCPTNAIYINKKGKYKFKASKCAMCMRCTMNCPVDAITFGMMNPWKVNRPFKFEEIAKNKEIAPEYINENTKGYFKKFNKYFSKQKALLEKYNIENPIESYLSK